jgi:hypothetical protein
MHAARFLQEGYQEIVAGGEPIQQIDEFRTQRMAWKFSFPGPRRNQGNSQDILCKRLRCLVACRHRKAFIRNVFGGDAGYCSGPQPAPD